MEQAFMLWELHLDFTTFPGLATCILCACMMRYCVAYVVRRLASKNYFVELLLCEQVKANLLHHLNCWYIRLQEKFSPGTFCSNGFLYLVHFVSIVVGVSSGSTSKVHGNCSSLYAMHSPYRIISSSSVSYATSDRVVEVYSLSLLFPWE